MDIVISNTSIEPIYQQVYNQIIADILSGELPADFCLPSIRVIARELNVSVITIKNAWDNLEKNGFIYTIAGKGCFVSNLTTKNLDDKRIKLAKEHLEIELNYQKNLGLTKDEVKGLIDKLY